MNFIKELKWRGMIHDMIPGTEEELLKSPSAGYIGFDPTSDSLHIGSLVQIMTLVHFQRAGHSPIALIGGATGMVGDPSGKSQERNLLDEETIAENIKGVQLQLERFLDFTGENAAEIINNYDWFKNINLLEFIRDVGKHISVNYMMAKDSVKSRLETGLSFTEFTYQLVQGYDFYYLNKHKNCIVQLGGSDQWGNIVTGTELVRRKGASTAYAVTTPLIKKADGTKFGKTESGNIWLDKEKTSPYAFYQYWLNSSDADASNFIKIFTLFNEGEILNMQKEHDEAPHMRSLQKKLAKDVTIRVHGAEAFEQAVNASKILFGKSTQDELLRLSTAEFLEIFEGVPQKQISRSELADGISIVELLAGKSGFLSSNGEARRALKANCISVNKEKVNESFQIDESNLINNQYLLLGKGKRSNYIIVIG